MKLHEGLYLFLEPYLIPTIPRGWLIESMLSLIRSERRNS